MDVRQLDETMFVGPQIRPEDVAGLKAMGIEAIINNRPDGEEPGQPTAKEIEAAARDADMAYYHIPVTRGPKHEHVEATRDALKEVHGDKMFAFCRSGTRSTLTWAVARSEEGDDSDELKNKAAHAGYDLTPVDHLL